MLNEIKNHYLGARCTALTVTTASSVATVGLGVDDKSAATSAATGKSAITLKDAYARLPIVVATNGANVALGGFATYDTASTKTVVTLESLGVAGSGDDGTIHAISFGWDYVQDEHLGFHQGQPLTNTNGMEPVLLALRINADATVAIGNPLVTVSKASSVYTITFNDAFARACTGVATPIEAAAKGVRINSTSATNIVVATSDVAGTPEDNAFDLVVLGWFHKDAVSRRRSIVQTPRRKPKIILFQVTGTGTAAVNIGSDDITLTDNGTGDYTLAWKAASKFTQAPIVIATGLTTRIQTAAAATATSTNILSFNAGGTATDGVFQGIAIGFDVADEYKIFG